MKISNITNSNPSVYVCVWIGSSQVGLPNLLTQTVPNLIALFWRIKTAMTQTYLKCEPNQPNKIGLVRFLGSPKSMQTPIYSNICLIMEHHVLKFFGLLHYILLNPTA